MSPSLLGVLVSGAGPLLFSPSYPPSSSVKVTLTLPPFVSVVSNPGKVSVLGNDTQTIVVTLPAGTMQPTQIYISAATAATTFKSSIVFPLVLQSDDFSFDGIDIKSSVSVYCTKLGS